MSSLRPRLCVLERGSGGYGFHLHGEKGKTGQFIRLVEPDTPAAAAGLLAGDRLAFVNGESVEGESHQQVVARIRATAGALELVVVDADTAELLSRHSLQCRKEFVAEGIPLPAADSPAERGDARSNGASPRGSSPAPRENGDSASDRSERLSVSSGTKDERGGPRPRLCQLGKGANGYGFNLHSEKSKPGQFIRAVDDDSPAQRAGLKPQDKIIQVNGVSVIGMQHSEVVAAIKAGGDQTRLLVVDAETDEFFRRCNVLPLEEHVSGPLPEPGSERASEDEEASAVMKPHASRSSSASSDALLPAETTGSPPPGAERAPEAAGSLGLSMSLAQARERAHQKRSAKKAPPMDWSKRNELFSNL
ncbi:putative Na(+)/H(+) exchange regulatory cofactor NHE-RF1-like [Scophthalmus maximus]|uniref:Na(+)/H(+) exchange regulatory cofactor NHE-RF n=1 Tax=Scophthalmus maximus TaxID=52904 RepID=A0A2U9CNB1_SCOMX|nr:Na(+)/H(+) exchange regulatory cofactor NHE-RF1a [Scophthalmus maximus]AWP17216.1 putative Na(+)/H(+) exchange regulatory cofactor NHE-RF1-like [Scophthalmus maximus]